MSRMLKNRKLLIVLCVIAVISVVAGLAACAPKANKNTYGNPTVNVQKADISPTPDKYGVVKGEQWKDAYPYEYNSYLANATNTPPAEDYLAEGVEDTTSALPEGFEYVDAGKANYLETNPEIKTLGKGYGYAKYYTEPAGHVYSLWSITHNGRVNENTKAACLTCKTPQYSGLVDMEGEEVHLRNMWDVYADGIDENISCASCHANDPMTLEVDRAEWVRAMGADHEVASLQGQVCGQCHCDYSMAPGTSIPTSPYDNGRADMVPEKALQWYDDHDFADWTYETTGAKMLAVRHAEYEFIYGGEGSHMQQLGYDCNDCHMATTKADDGTVYTDHHWINPTENDELIARDCSKCHADLKAEVAAWQKDIDGATQTLGQRCEQFIFNFEAAIADGKLTDEQLERLRYIQRASCYYWNLVAAENSEGAHNPSYYWHTIDLGNSILDEGDEILGVSSVVK